MPGHGGAARARPDRAHAHAGHAADDERRALYEDIALDVYDTWKRGSTPVAAASIARLIVDPGIGFGKRGQQNLERCAARSTTASAPDPAGRLAQGSAAAWNRCPRSTRALVAGRRHARAFGKRAVPARSTWPDRRSSTCGDASRNGDIPH
jgi:hypothetical protein